MERNIYKYFSLVKFRVIAELQELVQFIFVIEVSDTFAGQRLKIPASLYFDLIIPVCGQLQVIRQGVISNYLQLESTPAQEMISPSAKKIEGLNLYS